MALPAAREGAFWGDEFDARLLDARITSAQGDPSAALEKLGPIRTDARAHGCVPCELDVAIAAGEAELAAGKAAEGRTRLEGVEKDAKSKGFLLLAKKAAAARGRP
jgi:hypothetical protein